MARVGWVGLDPQTGAANRTTPERLGVSSNKRQSSRGCAPTLRHSVAPKGPTITPNPVSKPPSATLGSRWLLPSSYASRGVGRLLRPSRGADAAVEIQWQLLRQLREAAARSVDPLRPEPVSAHLAVFARSARPGAAAGREHVSACAAASERRRHSADRCARVVRPLQILRTPGLGGGLRECGTSPRARAPIPACRRGWQPRLGSERCRWGVGTPTGPSRPRLERGRDHAKSCGRPRNSTTQWSAAGRDARTRGASRRAARPPWRAECPPEERHVLASDLRMSRSEADVETSTDITAHCQSSICTSLRE